MHRSGIIVLLLLGLVSVVLLVGQRLLRSDREAVPVASERVAPAIPKTETTGEIVRVIDGDTLAIGDERIRLFGIDAPEANQLCSIGGQAVRCGDQATAELTMLLRDRRPTCEPRSRDRNNRVVAVCSVDGRDIARHMVASGWAVAFRRYSDDYVADEASARAARRGVWQGDFTSPDEWRAEQRARR